jgi:Zn-dependent metalloprotease
LVRFLKFIVPLLGVFTLIGISLYFVDLKEVRKEVEETWTESQKLDLSIRKAQLELTEQTTKLQKEIDTAEHAALSARNLFDRISQLASNAEAAEHVIEQNRERSIVAISELAVVPSSAYSPIQMKGLVIAELIDDLRDVLPKDQYALLQTKLGAHSAGGLRRQVFDGAEAQTLPGKPARSEGEPPVADDDVNAAYDNLKLISDFIAEVLGRDISAEVGGTIVASVHYGKNFNNAFWNGQQIVMGDGDGSIFRKGGFVELSVMAHELGHALAKQLTYEGQSGAINQSFSNIIGTLVLQWRDKQTVERANWTVGAGIFSAPGAKALLSLKDPGSAYNAPDLGQDPQVGTMSKYDDNKDFHINSGIPNHAFYELARRLGGYAWDKPLKIWYESVRNLRSDATFQDLANATVAAAKRLYGASSQERKYVIDSWAAVEIAAAAEKSD